MRGDGVVSVTGGETSIVGSAGGVSIQTVESTEKEAGSIVVEAGSPGGSAVFGLYNHTISPAINIRTITRGHSSVGNVTVEAYGPTGLVKLQTGSDDLDSETEEKSGTIILQTSQGYDSGGFEMTSGDANGGVAGSFLVSLGQTDGHGAAIFVKGSSSRESSGGRVDIVAGEGAVGGGDISVEAGASTRVDGIGGSLSLAPGSGSSPGVTSINSASGDPRIVVGDAIHISSGQGGGITAVSSAGAEFTTAAGSDVKFKSEGASTEGSVVFTIKDDQILSHVGMQIVEGTLPCCRI
jgi:hypothetical protein